MEAIARFAARRGAVVLIAAWAFGEALVLPVVPDVALDLLALAAPRRAVSLFVVATLASLAGSLVLFAFASAAPGPARDLVLAVPGVHPAMLDGASAAVASGAPWAIAQFGPGTPLKVDTVAWATGPGSVVPFVVGAVLNRITRIVPALLLAAVVGIAAPRWLRRHERFVIAAYAAAWITFYAFYLGSPA
jgi:membrane protein YqaA with SNARE-associated domain